jgi:hypothetical protein
MMVRSRVCIHCAKSKVLIAGDIVGMLYCQAGFEVNARRFGDVVSWWDRGEDECPSFGRDDVPEKLVRESHAKGKVLG